MGYWHLQGERATERLGRQLAAELRGGEVLALCGELGTGKTCLTRGLARGLGVAEAVSSPTFAIVQEYGCDRGRLYHIDLYRLAGPDEAAAFGLEAYLEDAEAVCVMEWPERAVGLLPPHTRWLQLEHESFEARNVRDLGRHADPPPGLRTPAWKL